MRFPVSVLVIVLAATVLPVEAADVRVSSPERPALLDQADLRQPPTAMAISPDGTRMAYAYAPAEDPDSHLLVYHVDGSDPIVLLASGTIRDLLFPDDSGRLLGLRYQPAKRQQGDTYLIAWDGTKKPERIMRVPPSASDLDVWPGGNAILLACRNEIRTLLPPDFRSGPLFSFPGDNFAVSSLGQSSYVLVGQEDGIFLLDLASPSGRESMPVLASRQVPSRVAVLADDVGGDGFWTQLADGRVFHASFEPPEFRDEGLADRLVAWHKSSRPPAVPDVAPEPAVPVATMMPPVVAEPAEPEAPDSAPAVVNEEPPAVVEADPASEPATLAEPVPAEEEAPAPPVVAPTRQLEGRVLGALDLVEAVVLLGPDNILREAARVQPDADGNWSADGLTGGRYRIQLDGGGDRVLVARPRFLMVEVGEKPTRAPDLTAVRAF